MLIAIPPKYAVSQVVGYIKGKSAIYIYPDSLRNRQKSLASGG
jgi:REP element-mobilizing transposase RayT